ncbi:CRISPR-associated Csd2 family protein [Melghiribacillus thermohalophilus]|uniref:CRISPR-associated Csd2 family protein n=1 Tax=Melghiribacillus thermohalophilus TaxID=1324956 RepID=A0A4R3N0S3_9BACI|nr:type I-C CRISPR-associated protein Cas7/Csd2 [Melghiribacillus thermohalophilus]TCT21777.1 CRISPR-associated Csd2 family protein [Melghiribacillus thermohalophilus]
MKPLQNKIDFAVVFTVKNANPNGDPLNGNRPRQNYDGYGEVSDVCLKRKIRNRLQDMGESIFVQSNDRNLDGFKSLKDRADSVEGLKKAQKEKDPQKFTEVACSTWVDVRSFGQVFAWDKLSVGIRGPVSIHPAVSVHPIDISSLQITKSVNSTSSDKKGADTMGMKHRVDFGVYVFYGSINTQLAEKTGFTNEDAQKIKEALLTLFENDSSSARPDGSMEVHKVYWWKHHSKLGQYSSAKVHRSLKVEPLTDEPKSIDDIKINLDQLEDLEVEFYDGQ